MCRTMMMVVIVASTLACCSSGSASMKAQALSVTTTEAMATWVASTIEGPSPIAFTSKLGDLRWNASFVPLQQRSADLRKGTQLVWCV